MGFEIIKRSKLRTDIERMLTQGVSPRKISEWTRKQGHYINYLTIHKYKKEEFNFFKAAIEEVETPSNPSSPEIFESGKRTVMADLRFCNRIIEVSSKKIEELKDDLAKVPQFKTFVDAGIRAIELKLKIAGEGAEHGQPTTINLNFNELRIQVERELAAIKELEDIEVKKLSAN